MVYYLRQRMLHPVPCLLAIVENDYAARLYIPEHIVSALLRTYARIKVATYNIPHIHLPAWLLRGEPADLPPFYFAIGRPENMAAYYAVCFFYVVKVIVNSCFPAIEVVVGMVAGAVAFRFQPVIQFRVPAHIFTHTKECALATRL